LRLHLELTTSRRLHLEATKQTQRLLDAAPARTVHLGGRSYSTTALGNTSQRTPLELPAPDEHPLYSEWRIFDRWLQEEDERIAQEAGLARPLSLGNAPATAPSGDVQTAAILYHLRQQVDDAILLEENREKRATAGKRSHLSPSDATKREVRNMPPAPPRTYTLDSNHSGNWSGFDRYDMSSPSATIRPGPKTPSPSPPPAGSLRNEEYFGTFNFEQSPSGSVSVGRTPSVSTNRSSLSYSSSSRPSMSAPETSTAGTTPEMSHTLRNSLSRSSLATIALGEAALNWKDICDNKDTKAKVERTSVKYGPETKECVLEWRYREDTGISLRAMYTSSQSGKLKLWIEQHFPATGPSIPLTTTHDYDDGAVSIDFPRNSFGKLDKLYTDINYTFKDHGAAEKFQTLLYTNNNTDPAELVFDKRVLKISSNKNPTECSSRNLRLWKKQETHLEMDGPVTFDVLVLLFYTSALEEKGHWVEEPHYAFEWLHESVYKSKNDGDKLTLTFSKDPSRWTSDKLFQRRKSSHTDAQPKSPSLLSRKRKDSMEPPSLTRSGTGASASSNASIRSGTSMFGRGGRTGRELNRFGYEDLQIKFQNKKDRRAFLEVWKKCVKPLNVGGDAA
jgi:hypothetical protein